MFGRNLTPEHKKEEEKLTEEWRKQGLLGVFLAIVNHISMPKQYDLLAISNGWP